MPSVGVLSERLVSSERHGIVLARDHGRGGVGAVRIAIGIGSFASGAEPIEYALCPCLAVARRSTVLRRLVRRFVEGNVVLWFRDAPFGEILRCLTACIGERLVQFLVVWTGVESREQRVDLPK